MTKVRAVARGRTAIHGTVATYVNLSCRCDKCREANARYHHDLKTWKRNYGELVPGWREQLHQSTGGNQ